MKTEDADTFTQICKVRSDEYDGDDAGREWSVHYTLYETRDDDGGVCFDLYDDDGCGNGTMIARGYHKGRMVSLTLRLGEQTEWAAGIPLRPRAALSKSGA